MKLPSRSICLYIEARTRTNPPALTPRFHQTPSSFGHVSWKGRMDRQHSERYSALSSLNGGLPRRVNVKDDTSALNYAETQLIKPTHKQHKQTNKQDKTRQDKTNKETNTHTHTHIHTHWNHPASADNICIQWHCRPLTPLTGRKHPKTNVQTSLSNRETYE